MEPTIKYLLKLFLIAICQSSFMYFTPLAMCPGPTNIDCSCTIYQDKIFNQTLQVYECCQFNYYASMYYCISMQECRDKTVDHSFDAQCEAFRIVGIISYVVSGLIILVPAFIVGYILVKEKVLTQIAAKRTVQMFNQHYKQINQNLIPQEQICSICLSGFERFIPTTTRKCKHCFHTACIKIWFQKSRNCPLCRAIQ